MAGELRGRNIGQARYKKIANSVVFIVQRINIYIYMYRNSNKGAGSDDPYNLSGDSQPSFILGAESEPCWCGLKLKMKFPRKNRIK